jgi:hypothetical protein
MRVALCFFSSKCNCFSGWQISKTTKNGNWKAEHWFFFSQAFILYLNLNFQNVYLKKSLGKALLGKALWKKESSAFKLVCSWSPFFLNTCKLVWLCHLTLQIVFSSIMKYQYYNELISNELVYFIEIFILNIFVICNLIFCRQDSFSNKKKSFTTCIRARVGLG